VTLQPLATRPPRTRGTAPLVWLPEEFDAPVPPGVRTTVADPLTTVPPDIADVECMVVLDPVGVPFADLVPRMPGLRVLQTLSAGVDALAPHLPPGAVLCNGRSIHTAATAELAVTLTLAAQREIPEAVLAQQARRWDRRPAPGLADQRVMVLGHGSIGAAIEARLAPFEVEVVRVARTGRPGVHGMAELDALLPGVDVVLVVVPLTDETRGLVDEHFLGRMRDGALLVNVARGQVVVTADLLAACRSGRIRAAVDVTDPEPLPADHPLWGAPNLLITPHVGALTAAMGPRLQRFLAQQLERLATDQPLLNVVRGQY
jgi:phosphoglycerate dehydrogenase-like enzyme